MESVCPMIKFRSRSLCRSALGQYTFPSLVLLGHPNHRMVENEVQKPNTNIVAVADKTLEIYFYNTQTLTIERSIPLDRFFIGYP